DPDQPLGPDASLARTTPLAPGTFVEANFVMGAGAAVRAAYRVTGGALEWDLHEHDATDLEQFEVLESGASAAGVLRFTAERDGLYSYRWTNPVEAGAVRLEVQLALHGDAALHSWGP